MSPGSSFDILYEENEWSMCIKRHRNLQAFDIAYENVQFLKLCLVVIETPHDQREQFNCLKLCLDSDKLLFNFVYLRRKGRKLILVSGHDAFSLQSIRDKHSTISVRHHRKTKEVVPSPDNNDLQIFIRYSIIVPLRTIHPDTIDCI